VTRHPLPSARLFRFVALGLFCIGVFAVPAFSQGCALCYTQAASSGAKMIEALKTGILILVIPPTLGSIGMIFVLRRKCDQIRRTDDVEYSDMEYRQNW
jgi:hypothetical protein